MANPKSYKRKNIILLVAVLAVIAVSISVVVFYILPQQGANSSASSICSGDLSVSAGEFTYKSFQIASGKSTAFIVGSFSTTGSSTGSDISAFILNQAFNYSRTPRLLSRHFTTAGWSRLESSTSVCRPIAWNIILCSTMVLTVRLQRQSNCTASLLYS